MIVYISGGNQETRAETQRLLTEARHRLCDSIAEADAVLMFNAQGAPDLLVELGMAIVMGRVVYLVDPGAQRSSYMNSGYGVRTFNLPWEALEAIDKDDFVELEG